MGKVNEYDPVVEDIYLTTVNDRELNKRSIAMIVKMINERRAVLTSEARVIFSCTARIAQIEDFRFGVSPYQISRAWDRVVEHLMENALREISESNLCCEVILPAILDDMGLPDDLRNRMADIIEHLENANDSFQKLNESLKETKLMSELQNTPVKSITYIYGRDVNTLSKDDLMNAIKRIKKEIADLESAGVESKFVNAQVKSLNDAVDLMVSKLDEGVK